MSAHRTHTSRGKCIQGRFLDLDLSVKIQLLGSACVCFSSNSYIGYIFHSIALINQSVQSQMSLNLASSGYPGTISIFIVYCFNSHYAVIHKVGSFLLRQWFIYWAFFSDPTAGVFWSLVGGKGWVQCTHQKNSSHFINDQKGWWISVALSFINSFLIHFFIFGASSPHSPAPSGLSCCCNVVVVVVYHWMSDANLCFALALCLLLVVVHILSAPPPPPTSLSVLPLSSSDL